MFSEFVDFIEGAEESAGLHRARVRDGVKPGKGNKYAGKLAIVTGGGSGIGRETLLSLRNRARKWWRRISTWRRRSGSAELAELLGARRMRARWTWVTRRRWKLSPPGSATSWVRRTS